MKKSFAIIVLAALATAFAQAATFDVTSNGHFTVDPMDSNLLTQNETVTASDNMGVLVGASLVVASDFNPSPIVQTATYTSGANTIVLDLMYMSTVIGGFGVNTDSGTWTVKSGTGAFAGFTGSGSYAISYNVLANQYSSTQVVGNVDAVPEPASLAALALGGAALLRRRRRA